jgi:broad specificity phosphatase PhoE
MSPRHGETEWNVEKRMQGHQDSPLTEKGVHQGQSLGQSLNAINFAAIYSSSSPRAVQTAELIRNQKSTIIELEDDLREIFLGSWEGQNNIEQAHPEDYYSFWNMPHIYSPKNGGESYREVQNRVLPLIREIIDNHKGEEVLVVSHTVTLKLIMSYFEGRSLEKLWELPYLYPTSLSKVAITNNYPTIELYADVSHFKD